MTSKLSGPDTTTEVELSISCRNLKAPSKSNIICITFIKKFASAEWEEMHKTDAISAKNHNPDFLKKINIKYQFEERQCLKFEIHSIDDSSSKHADELLGTFRTTLGQLVASRKIEAPIAVNKSSEASIIVTANEMSGSQDDVTLAFSAVKLDKKDLIGKSDPFLIISRWTDSGEYLAVHKTEVIKNNLNPTWKPFTIPVRSLCNGDYDRNIKFACYDYDSETSSELIGEVVTTLRDLSACPPGARRVYEFINKEIQKKKKKYTNSGELHLTHFELKPAYTFTNYIAGGVKINCTLAIDFTLSNGDPMAPGTLHYIGSADQRNAYEQVIVALASILQDYDSDKLFPVLGFGAKLPPNWQTSHDFFVNMSQDNPDILGVDEILKAYRSCLRQIQLHGPTHFSPVIKHVSEIAKQHHAEGSMYSVLIILTDGIVTDMQQTVAAIVEASTLPMSIVIVGIGNADFTGMDKLDADEVALQSGGRKAARDIVQFVNFQKMLNRNPATASYLLAKEVLAEVPSQLTSYMKANGIAPRK